MSPVDGHERHALVARRGGEVAVEGGLAGVLGRAPAHRDHRDAGHRGGHLRPGIQVRPAGRLASTRTMGAGAMACAHSTSSASSSSQFPGDSGPRRVDARQAAVPPVWSSFRKLGGSGRPYCRSNCARSLVAEVGGGAVDQRGVIIGVDDGDGLAGAVAGDRAEGDGVEAVGRGDLLRAQAPGCGLGPGLGPRGPSRRPSPRSRTAARSSVGRRRREGSPAGRQGGDNPGSRSSRLQARRSGPAARRGIGAGGGACGPPSRAGSTGKRAGRQSAPPRRAGPMVRGGHRGGREGPGGGGASAIARAAASGRARLADHKPRTGPAPGPDH